MDESYYTARLVITEGCEDRLDMTITCQNAQQLLRAKDTIADQMNTYIAEFAMQSNLIRKPSNAEQNAAALQAVIQEQTEKAKQQESENRPANLDWIKSFLESDFLSTYESLDKEDQRRLWRSIIEAIYIDGTEVTGIKPRI